jgi:ATP-binding cassette subfamily B protein
LPQKKTVSPVAWLWKSMSFKEHLGYCVGFLLTGITAATMILNPMLSQRLIDEVITPANTEPLIGILVTMLVITVTRLLLRYGMVIVMEVRSTYTLTEIRRRMFDVIQHQDYKFLDKFPTGNLMTRITSDLELLRHVLAWVGYQSVDCVVLFGSALTFFVVLNWKLALSLAAVTPFILIISRMFIGKLRPCFMTLRAKLTQLGDTVKENIDGNRVVKAFARENYEVQKMEKFNDEYRKINYQTAYISARYGPLLDLLSQILIVETLLFGGILLIRGEMSFGQYMAFSSLTWALANPLRMLGMLLADLQRFYAAGKMIIEVAESTSSIVDAPDAIKMVRSGGRIEYKNVNFEIDGNPILQDISFSAEPGSTIGIFGSTGSGKTSLVNMLLRFYETTSGEVLIDGVDVKRYTLSSLRRHIGIAMQEVFLFSDTIKNNIAYGRPSLEDEIILQRAHQANADSFIVHMENGYETIVGERGVGLSGGQRQRLALARAIAVKPSILILDDTTSAVDSETEAVIQEELKKIDFPCTKIIIAARTSSFRDADLILVMDNGRIVERGTHAELIRGRGFYHHIWAIQQGIGEDAFNVPAADKIGDAQDVYANKDI